MCYLLIRECCFIFSIIIYAKQQEDKGSGIRQSHKINHFRATLCCSLPFYSSLTLRSSDP